VNKGCLNIYLTMLADEAGTPAGKVVGTLTEGLLVADELGVVDAGGWWDDDVMAKDELLRLWFPPLDDCLDEDCLLLGFEGGAIKE
jgi:hypothetical protein